MQLLGYVLALLLAWLTPEPPAVSRLASPAFRDREAASRALRSRLTYAVAVRLTLRPPADAEARYRVQRLLAEYWHVWDGDKPWPYIDALNPVHLCTPPNLAGVESYLRRVQPSHRDRMLDDYRAATGLLVADLRWLPPQFVRALLREMGGPVKTPLAEALAYRRMPGSPSTWVMTTVRQADGTFRQELRPATRQEPPK